MRPSNRNNDQLRDIKITHNFTKYAEGSVLVEFGNTKVLCNASVEKRVPRFLDAETQGWLTAEYSMLPRSTHSRMRREASQGKQGGRTLEIQRLIGRALRASIDLSKIPGYTIMLDCDVIQADGGTRTASITGACIALKDAITCMQEKEMIAKDINPIISSVAAISVGMYNGEAVLDLDYDEDSNAETDMNIVINSEGGLVEIQGTAEGKDFSENDFAQMLSLAKKGIKQIFKFNA